MIHLSRNFDGVLELDEGGSKYAGVKLIRTFPLTMPDQYISVRTQTDEEITMITDLSMLEDNSRREAEKELKQYYVVPTIHRIISIVRLGSEWVWVVDTSYGRMTFRMNEMHESMHPLSQVSWLLSDIEGRRFIISNIQELDESSMKQWGKIDE